MDVGLSDVPQRDNNFVARKVGNDMVIVPLVDSIANMDKVYTLNVTATLIFEAIDGKRTVGEIVDRLTDEYNVPSATALHDVKNVVDELLSKKIVFLH